MRTLNQTWTLCLRMWRSISKEWIEGDDIYVLKDEWIENNGFLKDEIDADCFFCDYVERQGDRTCSTCPGKLVDINFHCEGLEYNFRYDPPAFYKELLRLNRIRKEKLCKNTKSKSKKH